MVRGTQGTARARAGAGQPRRGGGEAATGAALGPSREGVHVRHDWLKDWAEDVGTDLAAGLAEPPGWSVFALEDGVVYHTYSRTAPDRFLLAPFYYQLLDQIPARRDEAFTLRRHDEY
jgi:predicted dithiol-disulfide oxidoreductase (DUF899 family)